MIVVHWKGSITVHLLITCQSFFLQLGEFRFQCIQESPTSVHCCMFPQFPQAPFETTVSFGDDYIKPLLFSLAPLCLQSIGDFSVPVPCDWGRKHTTSFWTRWNVEHAQITYSASLIHVFLEDTWDNKGNGWIPAMQRKGQQFLGRLQLPPPKGWIITSSPCSPHLSWHFRKDLWVTSTWSPTSLATVMILTKTHGWKMEEKYQQPVFQMCKDTSWWDGSPWRQVHETC